MRPFVVDSNAIHRFQRERISGETGSGCAAINGIILNDCIALDEGEICYNEWITCAAGAYPVALSDWVGDQLISGKIRLYRMAPNTCRKHLTSIGLPQDDHKWVRLAIGSESRYLVSDDIDFLDPTAKVANAATRLKIRARGAGPCSKALQKEYEIKVLLVEDVSDVL